MWKKKGFVVVNDDFGKKKKSHNYDNCGRV